VPTLIVRQKTGERCVPFERGRSLRQIREATEARVRSGCNGTGACGLCRVRVDAGETSAPTVSERVHLDAAELAQFYGGAMPCFDIVLLGMGDDGHTASLFPHTSALGETGKWVAANYVPQKDVWRIILTLPVINAAQQVIFLVSGAEKAERLREVLYGPRQPYDLPSQLIEPTSGSLVWLLDTEAASVLPSG